MSRRSQPYILHIDSEEEVKGHATVTLLLLECAGNGMVAWQVPSLMVAQRVFCLLT